MGSHKAFGPEPVVWVSDYPWTKHEQGRSYLEALDALTVCVPDAESRHAILGVAAARLFRLPAVEPVVGSVTE